MKTQNFNLLRFKKINIREIVRVNGFSKIQTVRITQQFSENLLWYAFFSDSISLKYLLFNTVLNMRTMETKLRTKNYTLTMGKYGVLSV